MDVLLESGIEVGDYLLTIPCLAYQGRNDATLALYAEACPGKKENWIYVPKSSQGSFIFSWNDEIYVAVPKGQARIDLYRRSP